MKSPLVQFENVSIARGSRILLEDVNWTIHSGERWAIVGPSRSGKTSLAEALAGIKRVARGRVLYSFTDDDAPSERDVILLSAESQMYTRAGIGPYYQARWNSSDEEHSRTVRHFLSARGIYGLSEFHVLSDDEVPAEFPAWRGAAVEAAGVTPLLGRRLVDLSNGELRKVLLARALAQKPQFLILDDPLSGLDGRSQKDFGRFLQVVGRLHVNLVVVASDLCDLPARCATHVLHIDRRRVVSAGPLERLRMRSEAHPPEIPKPRRRTSSRVHGRVVIEVRRASVRYGSVQVLKNVTWTVRAGEKWAVLGPNGSGKTTLLGLILGDNPQGYACDIRVFGRPRGSGESIWDIKRRIGHVAPELQSFLPLHQTADMIVCSGFHDSVGLFRRCSPEGRRAATRAMAELGIAALATRRLGEMSSSEQRLVLIARALAKEPEILILDEPCQGLDGRTRRSILRLLDHLADVSDVTLIVVAHRRCDLPRSINRTLLLRRT